jgi:ribosomal protein S7
MGYLEKKVTHNKFNKRKELISFIIYKIIKGMQRSGKFFKFFKIFSKSVLKIINFLKYEHNIPFTFFDFIFQIISSLEPFCDVKNIKASGRTVSVPMPFRIQKKAQVAISFLINGFFIRAKKNGFTLMRAIEEELLDLHLGKTTSEAFQKKQEFVKSIFLNEKNLRFLKNI